MAHYAFLDENNIVVNVITGVDENTVQTDANGDQVGGSTEAWEKFYESLPWFTGLKCKRTSYSAREGKIRNHETGETLNQPAFRKNFAGPGFTYNEELDAFIPPKPDVEEGVTWWLNPATCTWRPI